jgi:hypothetical protein
VRKKLRRMKLKSFIGETFLESVQKSYCLRPPLRTRLQNLHEFFKSVNDAG